MDGRPTNYPPTYDEATKIPANFAPPPQGSVAAANAQPPLQPMISQPPIVVQRPPVQTVIVQPGGPQTVYVGQPHVVVVHPVKIAPCFHSYTEVCPYCNVSVVTHVRFVFGGMSCVFFILGIFFFPFFCFLLCDSYKDAHHFCPRCHHLIAIRKR